MAEKKSKNKFLQGALVLMLFGFLSKIIGAVYRIPLTGIIGAEGMGLYQMVFPLYTLLLTISSSGLPSSISKLISECYAKHEYRQGKKILSVSFILLTIFSVACSLIILFGARLFARFQGNIKATICYVGLAPAIIFVGLISGFRGYFQGVQSMTPSAISGFLEQLFKLAFGLYLALTLKKKGVEYGVLGALIGISLSEVFALLYLFISYLCTKKKRGALLKEDFSAPLSFSKTAKSVLSLSVFVTLGGLIMPLTMLIDSAVTINILKSIGFSVERATTMFGLQTGTVGSIINMPVVLTLSVATAILPCVSALAARGDLDGVRGTAAKAFRMAIIIALPATVGVLAFARPIITLLYGHSLSMEEIKLAASILEVASISIFYLSLLQVSSGLLQGLSRFYVPLISLAVGGLMKVVFNIVLIRIKAINILGGEVASSICYASALIINLWVLKRQGVIKLDYKILVVALLSGLIYFSKYAFEFLVKTNLNFYLSLMLVIGFVVVVYFFFVWLLYRKRPKSL